MKRSPTNVVLRNLVRKLNKASSKSDLWRRIASDLSMSSRQRRAVNISRIAYNTKENETIVVPGKVLGSGELAHRLTISAYSYSASAIDKLKKAGAKILSIEQLISENPKGSNVRIIG